MSAVPPWALAHLQDNLPPGNPILNGRALSPNTVLANTRLGAVLVRRSLFGRVRHDFVETDSDKVAFRCASCGENLQFYNLPLPATVHCSICAAKYQVTAGGAVTSDKGVSLVAEFLKAQGLGPDAPQTPCCFESGCCASGCDPSSCCPQEMCQCCADAAEAGGPAGAFTHQGYTLYRRDVRNPDGTVRPLHFFSKGPPKSGHPVPLPDGYEVGVSEKMGLPFLRRTTTRAAEATVMGYKGDSHLVIALEGIGPTWSERLKQAGVETTDELGRSDAQELAGRIGEAVETIRSWQTMAELVKVKGIGPQYAEALARAGIQGIQGLKDASAGAIAKDVNAWLDQQSQTVIQTRLSPTRVATWQKAARAMRRVRLPAHPLRP
jgi:predicted flap endonuclease-1-like 5' DNA nuclease